MQNQFERELLKTLKSIDGTLKRIEKSMNVEEKQHTTIYNAVSHALNGKNTNLFIQMQNSKIIRRFQILNFFNRHICVAIQYSITAVYLIFIQF